MMQVNLDRTDIRAGTTQRAGERQQTVLFGILQWRQDGTDRARDGGFITMAAAASVDRARIHAGTTANAVQTVAKLAALHDLTATVVNQHHMQLSTRPRAMKMRRVRRHRLTGG